MEQSFWHERWQRGDIGFHQPEVHDQLRRLWQALAVAPGSAVFVPLAGKSHDMVWLAGQGLRVIGVELSEIAVAEFFAENGLSATREASGSGEIWTAGPYTIHRRDFFELTADHLSDAAALYDRAALIALPPEMRPRYAAHLADVMPAGARGLLIAISYPEGEIAGPPFSVEEDEVRNLLAERFDVAILESRDGLAASENLRKRGLTRLEETAYRLRRRA